MDESQCQERRPGWEWLRVPRMWELKRGRGWRHEFLPCCSEVGVPGTRNGAPVLPGRRFWENRLRVTKVLNGLGADASRSRSASKGARAGFLLGALVDFDGTFKVGAVFDHDAGGGEIAVDGTVFLNFDAVF